MAYFLNNKTWRWIVYNTKVSPLFFAAFGGVCIGGPWVMWKLTQGATNPMTEEEIRRRTKELRGGRTEGVMMSRVNKERLGQLLGEIERHESIDDRYRAALRGETLTGSPDARIRGGGGTSLPLPSLSSQPATTSATTKEVSKPQDKSGSSE